MMTLVCIMCLCEVQAPPALPSPHFLPIPVLGQTVTVQVEAVVVPARDCPGGVCALPKPTDKQEYRTGQRTRRGLFKWRRGG